MEQSIGRGLRLRFATAAALVNQLVEAKQQLQLRRVLATWERYELIAIDEVGYAPMAEVSAEFLFQVIAERAEKAAVTLTTNLPFSEWTQVYPTPVSARRCSIASRTERTSSRPAAIVIDAVVEWRVLGVVARPAEEGPCTPRLQTCN